MQLMKMLFRDKLHQAGKIGRIALYAVSLHVMRCASVSWKTESLENSLCDATGRPTVSSSSSESPSSYCPVVGDSPYSTSSMSSGAPSFDLGRGNWSQWWDFSFDCNIGTSAMRHNWVIIKGWIRALVQRPWIDSMIPLLMTWPTPN